MQYENKGKSFFFYFYPEETHNSSPFKVWEVSYGCQGHEKTFLFSDLFIFIYSFNRFHQGYNANMRLDEGAGP